MFRIAFGSFMTVGILLVLYMSWLPEPTLGSIWFIPAWLAEWADANENNTLRTGVPFIILGIVVGVYEPGLRNVWYPWLIGWMSLVVIVFLAEVGQLILPNRSFDWKDVAWGSAGSLTGVSVGLLGKKLTMRSDRHEHTV